LPNVDRNGVCETIFFCAARSGNATACQAE
jgi:hypothetical protein